MFCSLSVSASCVAAMGADTALYNFEIGFLKNELIFYYYIFEKFFENFMDRKNDTMYRSLQRWSFRSLQSGHFIDVKNNEK